MDLDNRPLALGIVRRWLPAYPKFVSHAVHTIKMSCFPLEIEKNFQAMKSYRFLQQRRTRDGRNPRRLPDFCFAQISPLLLSFSRFWSSFITIEVSNEEEYSILRILYCYSPQQLIFLAFCNDFDTLSRAPYTLLRNTTLLLRNDVRSQLFPVSVIPRS